MEDGTFIYPVELFSQREEEEEVEREREGRREKERSPVSSSSIPRILFVSNVSSFQTEERNNKRRILSSRKIILIRGFSINFEGYMSLEKKFGGRTWRS